MEGIKRRILYRDFEYERLFCDFGTVIGKYGCASCDKEALAELY